MKKIIISLAAASVLLFTGCFIDSDTATVRINLGNIPVAKVEKKSFIDRFLMIFAKEAVAQSHPYDETVVAVHIGAFDANNQLLAKKSINTHQVTIGEYVEFDVPARNGVTIVVLGEVEVFGPADSEYLISYYGNSSQLNLTAGTTETVFVEMVDLTSWNEGYNQLLGILLDEPNNRIVWNKIIGASRYDVYRYVGEEPIRIQSNLNNFYNGWDAEYMHLVFDFAGKKSVEIDLAM